MISITNTQPDSIEVFRFTFQKCHQNTFHDKEKYIYHLDNIRYTERTSYDLITYSTWFNRSVPFLKDFKFLLLVIIVGSVYFLFVKDVKVDDTTLQIINVPLTKHLFTKYRFYWIIEEEKILNIL